MVKNELYSGITVEVGWLVGLLVGLSLNMAMEIDCDAIAATASKKQYGNLTGYATFEITSKVNFEKKNLLET